MTKNIVWDIQCISPPLVVQYCKKCGRKTEFVNSEQFRINAQRKYLDIWLIYKCTKCDTTWNSTIYSRISSKSISKQLLECFQNNDEALSRKYAMNTGLLQQNGVEVQSPIYEILGEDFLVCESVKLKINSEFHFPVKVSALLREKLKLSQSRFTRLIDDGIIMSVPQQDLRKVKLSDDFTILFNSSAAINLQKRNQSICQK